MIQLIKDAATAVGIAAVITNSTEKIETQLNSLTHSEEKGDSKNPNTVTRVTDLPIMLISWDIDTELNFSINGTLDNPLSLITALLMKKASNLEKTVLEDASVEMGGLFQVFIQELYERLVPFQRSSTSPITNCTYKLVPRYGLGKHSGVLCKWKMKTQLDVC
jgi:hypothetical protein